KFKFAVKADWTGNGGATASGTREFEFDIADVLTELSVDIIPAPVELEVDVLSDEQTIELGSVVSGDYEFAKWQTLETDGYSLEWSTASKDNLPIGIAFDAENKKISVNGKQAKVGTYGLPVTATAKAANVLEEEITGNVTEYITIKIKNVAPDLTSDVDNSTVELGNEFSATFSVTKGTQNLEWSIDPSELPSGLTFNGADNSKTATISGNVAEDATVGTHTFKIIASNDAYKTEKQISIIVKNVQPEFATDTNDNFEVALEEKDFSATFSVTQGNQNLEWSIDPAELPSGLTFTGEKEAASAKISGTVSEDATVGTHIFKIIASNDAYKTEKQISINVKNVKPQITTTGETTQNVAKGSQINEIVITATKGTQNLDWYYLGELPDGLNVEATDTNYTISGTVSKENTEAKEYNYTVIASNDVDKTSLEIKITVEEEAPVLDKTTETINAVKGEPITSVTIKAMAGTNLSWMIDTLPEGLTITSNDTQAEISGTVAEDVKADTYTSNLTLSNGTKEAVATITINVTDADPVITSENANLEVEKGNTDTLEITATGTNLSWSFENAPAWVTLSSADKKATITAKPGINSLGEHKFNVKLSNGVKNVSKEISITVKSAEVAEENKIKEAEANAPVISFDEDKKLTIEKTTANFKNSENISILSLDIVFTTDSGYFRGVVNEDFSKTLSVDVKVIPIDKDYKNYAFSMDIPALPNGLEFSGNLVSKDTFTDANEYNYHYELKNFRNS
ncbi:MAG: putative Ig domain-containing protein, partial [Synergistaceae bacterium]|nr:putative Ig domain-containing protein [Synergistaceae bacterium]